jgi:RNA polymerase sigma-70 factor (ECF subfamily)
MALFPTTQWGLVLAAGQGPGTDSRSSLDRLCRAYWHPVYAYARLGGRRPEEARDLTQGFFAHLLERELVSVAGPERGRFRSFLKAGFDLYASNERRKARARKRGAGAPVLSFDFEDAESRLQILQVDTETPETAFERHWARTLVARTLARLSEEMEAAGEGRRFGLLSPYLTGQDAGLPYRRVAETLEVSEAAVKVAIHRLRRRFGALLRDEVAQTVQDDSRTDEELRHVLNALGG